MNTSVFSAAAIIGCLAGSAVHAQNAMTVNEAVKVALDHYPAVRAARASVEASAAGLGLARTAYLPRADLLLQMNRATRNSVVGLLLPQPAVAENQRIIAEQNVNVARVVLAQYTGQGPESLSVDPGSLLQLPTTGAGGAAQPAPAAGATQISPGRHPQAAEQNAAVDESRA